MHRRPSVRQPTQPRAVRHSVDLPRPCLRMDGMEMENCDHDDFRAGTSVQPMSGPLAGIRVLDLTTVQMGPWCTRILADFGADMIKVEAPEGDSSRYTGVPRHRGMSGSFQHNARGKRSIAMDLKQPAAREALLRLVPTVEAFVSNIRPQALARLGLDYQSVNRRNASIVYLGMVG